MSDAGATSVERIYPTRLVEDLGRSGLETTDLRARPISPAEKAATRTPMGVDGYVLPYFSMDGKPLPFYRVRLYDAKIKYLQVAESPNHVYFPPRLRDLLGHAKYIILTEGEKKAAAAVKAGFPCVALGGVDSWKSRNLVLPKDAQIAQKANGQIAVRLPPGATIGGGTTDTLAIGLQELIDFVIERDIPIIIIYDADEKAKVKADVQRAAATLAFELRYKGVRLKNIRQAILPRMDSGKTGIDDLLATDVLQSGIDSIPHSGFEILSSVITECLERRSAFPRHPNPREYVNKALARTNLSRADQMKASLAVLSDMDARGQRLRSPDEHQLYYYSAETKGLIRVNFLQKPEFAETPFGRKLYQDYSMSWTDRLVLGWLGTQFSGEDPIAEVHPQRVLAWKGDTLYYQINEGTMARVTASAIDLIDNGEDGVLFEADIVKDIETQEFGLALKAAQSSPIENWWYDVLKEARIVDTEDDKQRKLLSLLYYISPIFYRWRGTQLPVEITTGEAGSGKSTLFSLRLSILTGVPSLRNAPSDLRDWNASLASTGALHVTDNVQLTNNDLKQRLSDEICRLVTEPNPSIEQRRLYSDVGIVKIPVRVVFGITAIRQPFQNIDIIQRSIITTLDKGIASTLKYDAEWGEHQLERRGGREAWLAHQLLFAQHILQLVESEWKGRYQARYRLINVEQLLQLAAKVVGWDTSWIAPYLESSRDARASETDWTLEGLRAYASYIQQRFPTKWEKYRFSTADIASWGQGESEFEDCQLLTNSRSLGRHMGQHKHTIATTAHIVPASFMNGKQHYRIRPESEEAIERAEELKADKG